MTPTSVNQPTARPTNKLTTATIYAGAITALIAAAVDYFWPGFGSPVLWAALSPAIGLVLGYFVKDAPNVVSD